MTVWAGLIVSRVLHLADSIAPTGREVDALLAAAAGPRLEVAEALAQAVAAQGLTVPGTDTALRAYLAARVAPSPARTDIRGLVVTLGDGRLGLTIGRGRVVESHGDALTVVTVPEPGRYVEAFTVPGVLTLAGLS